MIVRTLGFLVKVSPRWKRALWRIWYETISRRYRKSDWTLMNYGYAGPPTGDSARVVLCPEDEPDRFYIQLYHRVASGGEIRGAQVLEVGSGRGGGASYVARYLKPASMLGVDHSRNAAKLCSRIHSV